MMVTNKKRINIIKYHYSGVHITQLAQLNGLISPYIKVGKVYIIRIFNAITQKFEPPEYGARTLQTTDRQTDGRQQIANVNVSSRSLKTSMRILTWVTFWRGSEEYPNSLEFSAYRCLGNVSDLCERLST